LCKLSEDKTHCVSCGSTTDEIKGRKKE
jgi:hypothetical protein